MPLEQGNPSIVGSVIGYAVSFALGFIGALLMEKYKRGQASKQAALEIASTSIAIAKEIADRIREFDKANFSTKQSSLANYFSSYESIAGQDSLHNFDEALKRAGFLGQKCFNSLQKSRKAIVKVEGWHSNLRAGVRTSTGKINNPGSLATYRGLLVEARATIADSLTKAKRFAGRDTKKIIEVYLEEE